MKIIPTIAFFQKPSRGIWKKTAIPIIYCCMCFNMAIAKPLTDKIPYSFDFLGDPIEFALPQKISLRTQTIPTPAEVTSFYNEIMATNYESLINELLLYKEKRKPDDWFFYQLVRKTADKISPKGSNYSEYTLYKWFLLLKTGYHPFLAISANAILLYVQSDDIIYNIPATISNGKQFVCLNFHDYNTLPIEKNKFTKLDIGSDGTEKKFSYKITHIPNFPSTDYTEKNLVFDYYGQAYNFKIKLNNQVQSIFKNYPVSDYSMHFNVPLSSETYASLIPALKNNVKGMSQKNGVDYLMRFTRYAFLFEKDTDQFGKEKRMSPEETLLYDRSDCEDRASLFFYLIKEIYNLPMIVLSYPSHVTIAVQFNKPIGTVIEYSGNKYVICEPTPQKKDLHVGQIARALRNESYEVVYAYEPLKK